MATVRSRTRAIGGLLAAVLLIASLLLSIRFAGTPESAGEPDSLPASEAPPTPQRSEPVEASEPDEGVDTTVAAVADRQLLATLARLTGAGAAVAQMRDLYAPGAPAALPVPPPGEADERSEWAVAAQIARGSQEPDAYRPYVHPGSRSWLPDALIELAAQVAGTSGDRIAWVRQSPERRRLELVVVPGVGDGYVVTLYTLDGFVVDGELQLRRERSVDSQLPADLPTLP